MSDAYDRAALAGFAAGLLPPVLICPSLFDGAATIAAFDGSIATWLRPSAFTAGYWDVVVKRPGEAAVSTVVKTRTYAKRLAQQTIKRRNDALLWPHRN